MKKLHVEFNNNFSRKLDKWFNAEVFSYATVAFLLERSVSTANLKAILLGK